MIAQNVSGARREAGPAPPGMVWIEGGTFRMGSDRHYPGGGAGARGRGSTASGSTGTPVTNREFPRFVEATGHVTLAEIAARPQGLSGRAAATCCVPGSLVFTPPERRRSTCATAPTGGSYVPGADWRHPYGPGSSIDGLDEHPVVHVAYARRRGLRALGGQGTADRGRVGVRRARRAGRRRVRLGRRVRRPAAGRWPTPGRASFPTRTCAPTATSGTSPVGRLPAQRLRPATT